MTIEYSTSTVLFLSTGAIVLTAAMAAVARYYFMNKDPKAIAEKYRGMERSFSTANRTKYPEMDIFAFRNTFLAYGLLIAISLMIVAFSWTTYEKAVDYSLLIGDIGDEIEMETPRTAEPPPPPPPPPAPTVMQIVESEMPDIETIEFEDMSINEDTEIKAVIAPKKEVPPPPPPPPPAPEVNTSEIFKIVEEQPSFKGCEDVGDKMERKTCADAKLMAFIYDNITYPATARENNVSGTVVVQFVVETDGSVSNVSLVRDIGAGCGLEAMRVVKMMPQWNPGKQRGRAVRVMFTLPVKFKLA